MKTFNEIKQEINLSESTDSLISILDKIESEKQKLLKAVAKEANSAKDKNAYKELGKLISGDLGNAISAISNKLNML